LIPPEITEFCSFVGGKTHIAIRVTTRASQNAVTGVRDGQLLVSVTAIPENNKANLEVVKLLSKTFGIAKSKVCVVSGAKCRTKVVCIDGIVEMQNIISAFDDREKKRKV
jgi:uncharacterized protein (TIGR00251 family)